MEFSYELIRSHRKTVCLQLRPDGTLLVRCPMRMSGCEVERFVQSKASWIIKQRQRLSKEPTVETISSQQLKQLAEQACRVIPERTAYFAGQMGVSYGRITIRNQKTRWGSCSSKGNLNFNCLLMLAPPQVMDYVIVHELCHRVEMNHSKAFWTLVEKHCPDYQTCRSWLKTHGSELIRRM